MTDYSSFKVIVFQEKRIKIAHIETERDIIEAIAEVVKTESVSVI